jgi:hypothetical protein
MRLITNNENNKHYTIMTITNQLKKQLKTEWHEDAKNCLIIIEKLRENSEGHVRPSEFDFLVDAFHVKHEVLQKRYAPTRIGKIFLSGITKEKPSSSLS